MGRPARIDRAAVLEAALAVADEQGLGALTMQAVAARLGVTPMALYRHVGSKAALLDGMVETLLHEIGPPTEGAAASERLGAAAHRLRRTAQRHPGVFPLLLERPAATPEARRVRDGVCAALEEAGVPPGRVARAERLVSTALLGFAVSEVAGRFGHHPRRLLDDDFERLLELLADFVRAEVARG